MRAIVLMCSLFVVLFATPYEMARSYVEYYSRALPQRRDINFTLTALLNVGEELYYHYKINDASSKAILKMSDDELKKYRQMLIKRSIETHCKDPKVVPMLAGGIKLHHLFYRDSGAKLLFEFIIDKKLCNIP
ncbi:hypothetical protein U5B43_08490 [Campylobacter sp. 9BO]|uniref:hypothetical protein n=1 Tax=Campylobacter sp. 9BO TaxID=3424759 RepID=UPI003D351A32